MKNKSLSTLICFATAIDEMCEKFFAFFFVKKKVVFLLFIN